VCNQEVPLRNCSFTQENVGKWETERSRESSLSFTRRNKRKNHQPHRKMHGKLENTLKTNEIQHFAPSRPPRRSLARAIRGPHGALLGPQTAFQNPGCLLGTPWGTVGGLLGSSQEPPGGLLGGSWGLKTCSFTQVLQPFRFWALLALQCNKKKGRN